MSRGPHLEPEQIATLRRFWERGCSVKLAAEAARCNPSTVYTYYAKFDGGEWCGAKDVTPYHVLKPWQPPEFKPAHAYADVKHKLMRGR